MAPRDATTTATKKAAMKQAETGSSIMDDTSAAAAAAALVETNNNGTTTPSSDSQTTNNNKPNGFHLRWSRMTKTVDLQRKDGGLLKGGSMTSKSAIHKKSNTTTATTTTSKTILESVSGYAAPGQVLSLMGPSGSGKTSLLNVLSGRSSYQDGTLSINGDPVNAHTMKRLMTAVGYVKQSDIFFGHLTVRDQLTYTALLRLKGDNSTGAKHAEVERLLTLLRLHKVAESRINTVSGGERKRVNIGTELLTDPAVLLLDVSVDYRLYIDAGFHFVFAHLLA